MIRNMTKHEPTKRVPGIAATKRSKLAPVVSRRMSLPRWGDQDPTHRIPTFLEAMFFEGDDSAIEARRFDT